MARDRRPDAPAWQGCQMQRAKIALAERRRRLRAAAAEDAALSSSASLTADTTAFRALRH